MSKELELQKILSRKRKRESKLKDFKNIIFALHEEGFSRARICEILAENFPESEEFFTLSRLTSFMLSPRNQIQLSAQNKKQVLATLKFDSEKKGWERQSSHRAAKHHDEIVALVEQGYSRSIIAEYLSEKYGEDLSYNQVNFYVMKHILKHIQNNNQNTEGKTTRRHVSYKSFHNEILEYVNAGFPAKDILTGLQEAHPEEVNFTLANLRAYIKRAMQKEQQSPKVADVKNLQDAAHAKVNDVIRGKVDIGDAMILTDTDNSSNIPAEQAASLQATQRNNGNAFGGLSQETDKV